MSLFIRTLVAGLAVSLIGSAAAWAQPRTVNVYVYNFGYSTIRPTSANPSPEQVDPVINIGDTIQWIWYQGFHDVKSANFQAESWQSPLTSTPGTTFRHTFNNAGTFHYYCSIHGSDLTTPIHPHPEFPVAGMSAMVIVLPTPGAGAAMGLGMLALARRRR
jgi:plastocyanin